MIEAALRRWARQWGEQGKTAVFFVVLMLFVAGCSTHWLIDADDAGSGKIVVFENVEFRRLYKVCLSVLESSGVRIVETYKKSKADIIRGEGAETKVALRIERLTETSHELTIFTFSGSDPAKERDLSRHILTEIQRRMQEATVDG